MQRKTNYFAVGLIVASFLLSLSLGVDSASAASATITTNTDITLNASSAGNGVTIDEESIGITTTCNKGYNLTIATSTSTDLYLNGDSTKTAAFAAVDGTSALDSTNNTNKWGYTLTNNATSSTVFSPLSTTASSIRTISQTTDVTSETIPIYYGIKTDSTIDPGTYAMGNNGTITYYLTMNPLCNVVDIAYDGNNADAGTMGAAGTGVIHTGVRDGDTVDLIASNFSRDGYGFAGWSLDQDAGTKLLDNDNTNNPIVYGPQESITLPEGFTANDTDNDGIVKFYAVWLQSQGNLQGWMGCDNLDTATYDSTTGKLDLTKNSVTALTDQRDNDTYAVARLADGKCWMIENLRLNNSASLTLANTNNPLNNGTNVTIKHNYTDATTSNTLSPTSNVAYDVDTAPDGWCTTNSAACDDQSRIRTDNTTNRATDNPSTNSGSMYSYGNYYNWYSATAGRGTYSFSTNNNSVAGDLCPAGWHLPIGGRKANVDVSDFWKLSRATIGAVPANFADDYFYYMDAPEGAEASSKMRSYPVNYLYSGYASGGSLFSRGDIGYFWSSTAYSAGNAYGLYLHSFRVYPGTYNGNKYFGRAVRCVASDPQTYTLSYDANGGTGAPEAQTTIANGSATFTLSTTVPTRPGFLFKGWNTESDGSGTTYTKGQEVVVHASEAKTTTLYAIWAEYALLDTGQNVNQKLKRLSGNSSASVNTSDNITTTIDRSNVLPNDFTPSNENTISDSTSPLPIYAWYDSDNTTIHYYSEATEIMMNSDSSKLFYSMMKMSDLSTVSSWNASDVTNMSSMFYNFGRNSTSFSLDLSSWDVSSVTNMSSMFYGAGYSSTSFSLDLSSWDASKVADMSYMFSAAGYKSDSFSPNLSSWKISNSANMSAMFSDAGYNSGSFSPNLSSWKISTSVNMSAMFSNAGYKATSFSLDLSSWDMSGVTDMHQMFNKAGYSTDSFSLNLSSWNTSSVTNMSKMFYQAGENAKNWSISGLSSWDTSNVTDMSSMFTDAGYYATSFILDLSSWNTSNVTDMSYFLASAGCQSTTWSVGDLSAWNTSSVTDMRYMFNYVGFNATSWSIGDLSSWDTSKVTTMEMMFNRSGSTTTVWSVGDLSSWNTSSVTNMGHMFSQTGGYSATTWFVGNLSSWDTSSVTNMSQMFYRAGVNATVFSLDLSSWDTSKVTDMSEMFTSAGLYATTWSVIIPKTNDGTATGPIANTTSNLYGKTTSVTATPPSSTKYFTLAN